MAKKPARAKTAAKKAPPARRAAARPAKKRSPQRTRAADADATATIREELDEARAELARLASGENHARRDLESKVSAAQSTETRLRREQEALHIDLRLALADLEIARSALSHEHQRSEQLGHELAEAREAERLAAHSSDRAREQSADLRSELAGLRVELETLQRSLLVATEELKRHKELKA